MAIAERRCAHCIRRWRALRALRSSRLALQVCASELQGAAGQLRAQRGQRDTREDGASDIFGTLKKPFQHLLVPRLVHLGAEATTPAQRLMLRIFQQQCVPGFEGHCREDVEARLYVQCWVRLGLSHGRGIFAFGIVDTNVNVTRATFKLSFASF